MGRSYTPKYRVELVIDNVSKATSALSWDKRYGRATDANLAKLVRSIETSFLPGGANSHLRAVSYLSASIIRQSDGSLVAFYSNQKEL